MTNTLPKQQIIDLIHESPLLLVRMMLVLAYYLNGDDPDVANAWWEAGYGVLSLEKDNEGRPG